jgi:hypothetical protein
MAAAAESFEEMSLAPVASQPRTYCHIADGKLDLERILPAKVVHRSLGR